MKNDLKLVILDFVIRINSELLLITIYYSGVTKFYSQ
jgi:hypothetical protein